MAKELLFQLQENSDEAIETGHAWSMSRSSYRNPQPSIRCCGLSRRPDGTWRSSPTNTEMFKASSRSEDVLEEIVGDIVDEDRSADGGPVVSGRRFICMRWGRLSFRKLCRQLEIKLPPDTEASRLAGLIMESLGRIPVKGDIGWNGMTAGSRCFPATADGAQS